MHQSYSLPAVPSVFQCSLLHALWPSSLVQVTTIAVSFKVQKPCLIQKMAFLSTLPIPWL